MLRYLLDTNIVSELARQHPNPRVLARYHACESESAIPSVVWDELTYGVERLPVGRRRDFLAQFLVEVVHAALPILPYDEAAAHWHGQERARLEGLGRTRPWADGMIAAVAATRSLVLITRNTNDFADFDGLHLENWFEE